MVLPECMVDQSFGMTNSWHLVHDNTRVLEELALSFHCIISPLLPDSLVSTLRLRHTQTSSCEVPPYLCCRLFVSVALEGVGFQLRESRYCIEEVAAI
jgi:hypothetical protein